MHLAPMIRSSAVPIEEIGDALDQLDHEARVAALQTLGRSDQRALYEKALRGPAIDAEHFVPVARQARTSVRHHGFNSLPLPRTARIFEKRFCRPEDPADGRLFGYNEGSTRRLIGPGYFVALPTAGRFDWEPRGAIVVDYFQVPDAPVADGWPEVVRNEVGLQRFVFRHTRDFMRKVSSHVSVGAAFKIERPLDHYFVLCREP